MTDRGESSDELKTSVASFMGRADAIVAHKTNPNSMAMKLVITQDPLTGALTPESVNIPVMPLPDLFYLAVQMRPIIFTEQEPVSFNVLTKRIEREHESLRGRLKPGRDRFQEWKKHMFLGLQKLGTVGSPLPPGQGAMVAQVLIGPSGEAPSGIPLNDLSADYEYADAYLNAQVWHADADKIAAYEAASPFMRNLYAKCAEIRVVSAIEIVGSLREWIISARADGWDF